MLSHTKDSISRNVDPYPNIPEEKLRTSLHTSDHPTTTKRYSIVEERRKLLTNPRSTLVPPMMPENIRIALFLLDNAHVRRTNTPGEVQEEELVQEHESEERNLPIKPI